MLSRKSMYPLGFAAFLVLRHLWKRYRRARQGLREIPGPKPLFLIGNVLDMPKAKPHAAYVAMARKYGPIMQFHLPGHNLIVLNDAKLSIELLEKRGSIYADRPTIQMGELMGWGWNLTFMRHDYPWRVRRKYLHQYLHAGANAKLAGMQTRSAHVFVQRLLESPENFITHIRRAVFSEPQRFKMPTKAEDVPNALLAI